MLVYKNHRVTYLSLIAAAVLVFFSITPARAQIRLNNPPTILQGTGSGNSGTVTGIDATASAQAFMVSFTSGATPTGGATIWTVTFPAGSYTAPPHCLFSAASQAASNLNSTSSPYLTTAYSSGVATALLIAGITAITGNVAMAWFVHCLP